MSERLRGALRELGEQVQPARVDERTWSRARRARRRDRAVSGLLAVALLALAVWGGVEVTRSTEPPVVGSDATGRLPDEVFLPPDHIDVLEEGDAFEPVALVMGGAARGSWWGSTSQVAAVVGAESGSYRLLDLPGLAAPASTGSVSVSDDGTLLAWADLGVARTWSAVSGDVATVPVPSGASVSNDPVVSPDASQVAVQIEARISTRIAVVDVANGDTSLLPRFCPYLLGWSASGEAVLCQGPRTVVALDTESERARRLAPLRTTTVPLRLSPGGRYVLDLGGQSVRVTDLRTREVERLPGTGLTGLSRDAMTFSNPVRGWIDRDTAVVADPRAGLITVDVTSGRVERLATLPEPTELSGTHPVPVVLALNALGQPPYDAEEPDWGVDLRPWWMSAMGLLIVGGLVCLRLRVRRARVRAA